MGESEEATSESPSGFRLPNPIAPVVDLAKSLSPNRRASNSARLLFYGTLAGLAVVEIIEWPVAVVLGVGHALATSRDKPLQEVGEAMEEA
jgi:hypothetical protein